jgi:adenylate cyclase
MMAAFGLPTPQKDDEDRAVRSAISMITELRRWNTERVATGTRPIEIGIGVNTDTVVSGNIGAPKRMDYTIIGDGVNLASRLERACKQYCARILISESTHNKLRGTYRVREVDRVVVKGRKAPVAVYEVLDYHTEESFPHILEALQYFSGGVAYYRKAQWDKAIAAFNEAVALNPQDRLPGLYIERCEFLRANPPGNDWDGIWRLTTK